MVAYDFRRYNFRKQSLAGWWRRLPAEPGCHPGMPATRRKDPVRSIPYEAYLEDIPGKPGCTPCRFRPPEEIYTPRYPDPRLAHSAGDHVLGRNLHAEVPRSTPIYNIRIPPFQPFFRKEHLYKFFTQDTASIHHCQSSKPTKSSRKILPYIHMNF